MIRWEGLDAVEAVAAERARAPRAPRSKWLALAAVSLADFMAYLDNNVTNVALPTIQRDLHLSVSGLEWIVSSYLLVLAGLLLVGGRVADVYGRRRIFLVGLAVFTLSSLAAGLAGSGGMLIGARAVQGLGAAMLMPTTLAIILATFKDPRSERQRSASGARSARWPWRSARSSAESLPRPDHLNARAVLADLRADRGAGQGLDLDAHPHRVRGRRRRARGFPGHRDTRRAPDGLAADLPLP
jgi:hypothetical protein